MSNPTQHDKSGWRNIAWGLLAFALLSVGCSDPTGNSISENKSSSPNVFREKTILANAAKITRMRVDYFCDLIVWGIDAEAVKHQDAASTAKHKILRHHTKIFCDIANDAHSDTQSLQEEIEQTNTVPKNGFLFWLTGGPTKGDLGVFFPASAEAAEFIGLFRTQAACQKAHKTVSDLGGETDNCHSWISDKKFRAPLLN